MHEDIRLLGFQPGNTQAAFIETETLNSLYEPRHDKNSFLHMRRQRRRSVASSHPLQLYGPVYD